MNRWLFYFSFVFILGIYGCTGKENDDIVVIIEDATWNDTNSHSSDDSGSHGSSSTSTTTTRKPPSDRRTVSLSGAVRLLKNDLESEDAKTLNRHCEVLLKTVETEIKKSSDQERTRILNLFYVKLSGFKRNVDTFKAQKIPPTERIGLTSVLDDLSNLAKRIEGRD